ncbi:hypothetical protein HYN69_18165 (plasmid) [Gemmobacter aquarius]|uniref:Uncharacterized protein n=1 Tax=Paragemmobacter aquarius TaxID=2169400 RepID=A0A2S0URV5_9RHOB|nr:hypothetical protein HYN69_18165 [Gemmobacter aquarius]
MNRAQIVAILATAGASLTGPVTAQTIELARTLTGGNIQLAQAQINQCVSVGDIVCCVDGSGAGQNSGSDSDGGICGPALLQISVPTPYAG